MPAPHPPGRASTRGAAPSDTDPSTRTVVVAGGRGHVGRHLVRGLLDAGARVVVPFRSPRTDAVDDGAPADLPSEESGQERPTPDEGARLRHVPVADWQEPSDLLAVLEEGEWRPDAAVVALGGWWLGPGLVEMSVDEWRSMVESHLTSHFLAARALLPVLGGGDPVYVTLGGAAAEQPMVGSGPVSVTGAGQAMLLEVLRAEAAARPAPPARGGHGERAQTAPRLHELRVMAAVAGDDRNVDPQETVTPDQLTAALLAVLAAPSSAPVVRVRPTVSA